MKTLILCCCLAIAINASGGSYGGIDPIVVHNYCFGIEAKENCLANGYWTTEKKDFYLNAIMEKAVLHLSVLNASGQEIGIGSAVIIAWSTNNSFIAATCYHVIKAGVRVQGVFKNDKRIEFHSFMPPHQRHDVALLQYRSGPNQQSIKIAAAPLGYIPRANVLNRVITIGSPEGFKHTVAEGIISAIRFSPGTGTIIQTTAPISPGSSGGPLLDRRGYLIGLMSFHWSKGQTINFAIANTEIMKELTYWSSHPEAMIPYR